MKPSHLVSALSFLATLSCALPAFAQAGGFGNRGKFVVSAERLTGLFITSGSSELDGDFVTFPVNVPFSYESDDSSTTFAILGNGLEAEPAAIPRLGFDYFVIDALSVGGSITYASKSDDSDIQTQVAMAGVNSSNEETSSSLFSVSPRAGYAMMFSNLLGFWGRGGLTYTSVSSETDVTDEDGISSADFDASLLTLAVDAQLVIAPLPNFAIGVGPALDIPLTGSAEINDTDANTQIDGDISILTFGISAGMMVYF